MNEIETAKEVVDQILKGFVPCAERVIFRIVFDDMPIISGISYVQGRVVKDLNVTGGMRPLLLKLAQLKYAEIAEEIGSSMRMPKLVILETYGNGQRQRYEYNNSNALSISVNELGKPNSYYHPNTIILPDEITNKARAEFCFGKEVESEWLLVESGCESRQVSASKIKWDNLLRSFKKPTAEKWLLQNPAYSKRSSFSVKTGLKLTIFKDGTFYDEAVDKSLDIQWINNDGELNGYHWVSHGFVNSFDGMLFLVPTEHSELGTPEKPELKYVRYNDHDTKVVDSIELRGGLLNRCVSVLTDGVYLCRYMYVYSRL